MTKRAKQLKAKEQKRKWSQIGMFSDDRSCPFCENTNIIQIYVHDAWACIDCDEWLEEACDDPKCPYCVNRPETPYEVFWNTDFQTGAGERKMWRRKNYEHKMKKKFSMDNK